MLEDEFFKVILEVSLSRLMVEQLINRLKVFFAKEEVRVSFFGQVSFIILLVLGVPNDSSLGLVDHYPSHLMPTKTLGVCK